MGHALVAISISRHIAFVTPSALDLLTWYDRHRRSLLWRALPGQIADPYAVWLSEIMLQQTTVAAVMPYYESFLKRYPTVSDLAAASLQEVLAAWAGLGYYSRARNLHACAREVTALGAFPQTVSGLMALPGIGAYTARAIAAIAFGQPVVPVDGNVERVTARLYAFDQVLPAGRKQLAAFASGLNDDEPARDAPSNFAQALFDLGATVCTPRRPHCLMCPWRVSCRGYAEGRPERYPLKVTKKARPERFGTVYVMYDAQGALWLRHRPEKGLLGGMAELPGTDWTDAPSGNPLSAAPVETVWNEAGQISHIFTHFKLYLTVFSAMLDSFEALHNQAGFSCSALDVENQPLPSVMLKCLALTSSAMQGRKIPVRLKKDR